MEEERSTVWFFIKAAAFMLCLLLVLGILASLKSGVSLFDKGVLSFLSTIFMISLFILGILGLSVFMVAIFGSKGSAQNGPSVLVKDGTLRYDGRDERGRKKKINVPLKKIDEYLSAYSGLPLISGSRLFKKDKKDKPNANTLFLSLEGGEELSLMELSKRDRDFYNEVCAFLDRIKDKSAIDLSFSGRKYALQQDLLLEGRKISDALRNLGKKIKDRNVKQKVNAMVSKIADFEPYIFDNADRLRKLYDHYLKMLVQITENYIVMESHDQKIVDLSSSKRKLEDTYTLVSSVFDSFKAGEEGDEMDQLDADVQQVNAYLEKSAVDTLKK